MVAKAYTPLISDVPKFTIPVLQDTNIIQKEKEVFIQAARYTSNDGALHTATLYTVPVGKVLFIEQVAISGVSNDYLAAANAGYTHVTALGTYIGAVEYCSGSSSNVNNTYATPLKLLEGETIDVIYYQPTNLKAMSVTLIVSGYLLTDF